MASRNGSGLALLTDPTRLRIMQLLADHPRRPSVIARELGLSRPAVSRQIRLLQEAALVWDLPTPQDGRIRLLGINPDNERRIRAFLRATSLGTLPVRVRSSHIWADEIDPWDS